MANEKRLIDANEAKKLFDDIPPFIGMTGNCVQKMLDTAPTVDAVEVVRCKDCRDCEMCYPEKQLDKEATQAWICHRYKMYRRPDDFCSYGERKDNEKRAD